MITRLVALPHIVTKQRERRRVAKEARFLHCQAIHQGRPFHRAPGTVGHLAIVAGIVSHSDFAHATAQVRLEERSTLLGNHEARALFEQGLPVVKFG